MRVVARWTSPRTLQGYTPFFRTFGAFPWYRSKKKLSTVRTFIENKNIVVVQKNREPKCAFPNNTQGCGKPPYRVTLSVCNQLRNRITHLDLLSLFTFRYLSLSLLLSLSHSLSLTLSLTHWVMSQVARKKWGGLKQRSFPNTT